MVDSTPRAHRRVVTGHRAGKSVILSDERRPAYAFKTVSGFEHTYVWATKEVQEADPEQVERELPKSALPSPGGSLVQIVTFPPTAARNSQVTDPSAIAKNMWAVFRGLRKPSSATGRKCM
jgi:hypothetical protein